MHSKTNAGIMHRYSESIDTFGNSSEIDSDSNSDIEDDHEAAPFINHQRQRYTSYKSIASGTSNEERQGSLSSSIFTLVSTMIGGGLLSLPFAFEQGGFGVASMSLVFVLVASNYGGFLIINSKKYCHGKVKNIEDVAFYAFGKPGKVCS